jgi:hypothetical protein
VAIIMMKVFHPLSVGLHPFSRGLNYLEKANKWRVTRYMLLYLSASQQSTDIGEQLKKTSRLGHPEEFLTLGPRQTARAERLLITGGLLQPYSGTSLRSCDPLLKRRLFLRIRPRPSTRAQARSGVPRAISAVRRVGPR